MDNWDKILTVSQGNRKLGRIPNISLPPVKSCGNDLPCTKKCYALKAYRQYPATRAAWDKNYQLWLESPEMYEFALLQHLARRPKTRLFRWHVAGDIPSVEYLTMMQRIAESFSRVHFLAYTKRVDLLSACNATRPDNLALIISRWMGDSIRNVWNLPEAWVNFQDESRIPKDARKCVGTCKTCQICWNLGEGESVVFEPH